MSTARDRFLSLLKRDILELDAADLDFGSYRVLNHRRAALEASLATALPEGASVVLQHDPQHLDRLMKHLLAALDTATPP